MLFLDISHIALMFPFNWAKLVSWPKRLKTNNNNNINTRSIFYPLTERISLLYHKRNIYNWSIIAYSHGILCGRILLGTATHKGHIISISGKQFHHSFNHTKMWWTHFIYSFLPGVWTVSWIHVRHRGHCLIDNGILPITKIPTSTGRWMRQNNRWGPGNDTDEFNAQIIGQFEFKFEFWPSGRWHNHWSTLTSDWISSIICFWWEQARG